MKAKRETFPFLGLRRPWEENPNNIWLASTLHLIRNLQPYNFPGKLSSDSRLQVRSVLADQLKGSPALDYPTFLKAEDAGPLEKEFLYEHFLAPHSFQQAVSGEGFVIDQQGDLFASLNITDHLHIQITDVREQLEEAWHRLVNIETDIGSHLDFSFSPRFGYLSADPLQCGTGMRARLYLNVPALVHTGALDETLGRLQGDEIEVQSIMGGLDQIVGDVLAVQNRCTAGLTEENILEILRAFALKVMVAEKKARSDLRETLNPDMKDKISRAYGLAVHSYQLETVEAWAALSLLKLGLDLKWISGTTHTQLNELLFDCRRAHLVANYSEEIAQEELSHRRAEFIHSTLSNTQLNI